MSNPVTAFSEAALLSSPLLGEEGRADLAEKKRFAFEKNLALLTGHSGHMVVVRYGGMLLGYRDSGWAGLAARLGRGGQFAAAQIILCAMGSTWRRLVHTSNNRSSRFAPWATDGLTLMLEGGLHWPCGVTMRCAGGVSTRASHWCGWIG